MARILQVELAVTRIRDTMAAGAGRHHAVEHVDAARYRLDDIVRRADAHQVARRVGRQRRHGHVEHRQHRRLWLADREPADGIAIEAYGGQARRGLEP